ncbi:MAG: glucosaminidase domain-containing protein, partial [Actinomycetota bacterium]|nr:glucosaminidase domain-containing protein [Actinomycetota bacterium]
AATASAAAKGAANGQAAIPGMLTAVLSADGRQPATQGTTTKARGAGAAAIPGIQAVGADIPGHVAPSAAPAYSRGNQPPGTTQVPGTAAQAAFINQVAPGAMAAQARFGVPAAVTIAQAIEESGWGQSVLAVRDHNLFGIKGTGPAGSDLQPTQEYENGRWVTQTAAFKVYHNVAESIADHGQLLANGPSYGQAMADRYLPDAFATDLTGVYATDPSYGTNLIALMRLYNLYRYDPRTPTVPQIAGQESTASQAAGHGSAARDSGTGGQGSTIGQGGTAGQGGTTGQGGGSGPAGQGSASIPGVLDAFMAGSTTTPAVTVAADPEASGSEATVAAASGEAQGESGLSQQAVPRIPPRRARVSSRRYVSQIPRAVTTDFITSAKTPLARAEPLFRDVAAQAGIHWELLAACDWMQCKAQPRYSPVRGEKLGTVNSDGTAYHTKSQALTQAANDLVELAMAVYWIDITARRPLSVRNLANVFAAFRWGGLLKLHSVSAMEFPYSVEGLTAQQSKMRWPVIKGTNPPDKSGARFRLPFGAVPVVLSLEYPAAAELSAARR